MTSFLRSDRSTAIATWLFIVAALVFVTLVVGGATRLSGAGLSITEWKPISGALPPTSDDTWRQLFAAYRATTQARDINPHMTLEGFKTIFWWEWAHRLLARTVVGVAFALPFLYFLVRRQIPRRLIWRCAAIFLLLGLQGAIGWWMVKSGLNGRVVVTPESLTAHFGLAVAMFIALIWTGLDAWNGQPRQSSITRWRIGGLVLLAGIYLQALLGALVAGNGAGKVYTDWPLMGGMLLPRPYAGPSFWATIAHEQGAVQLHHRLGAYALFVAAIVTASLAARSRFLPPAAKTLAFVLAGVVVVQGGLGIATLMTGVPLWLGVLHQAGAAILLATATAFAWRVRRL